MRLSIQQLDELYKLLDLLKKDETIIKIDTEGKIKLAIKEIQDIVADIIV